MTLKSTSGESDGLEISNDRLSRLAREKSYLQLIINLINKIISVSGLDNIADSILQAVLNVIGGTNSALYYKIDNDLHYVDISGEKKQLDDFDDEIIKTVFTTGNRVEQKLDFSETQMQTAEFSSAYTWILPLKIGTDVIGVLKIENLHISTQVISPHLHTLFSYIAMALRNEIMGQSRLQKAYDELAQEVAERRKVETELLRSQELLETRVQERTAELNLANESLSKSYEAYQCILKTTSDGFMHVNASGSLINVNDSYAKISGYSVEELLAMQITDLETAESNDETAEHIKHIIAAGGDMFETKHRRKDGSFWDVEISCSYLSTESGSILAFMRDISERKRTQESLTASNELLKTIINTAPLRVFWKDLEMRYLGCNNAFATDAGAEHPGDIVGKNDYQLAWKEKAELYRVDDRRVIESGISKLFYDEPLIMPDGRQIWIRTSKVPLRNEAQEIVGILGIFEDINEYKLAEEALKESIEKFTVAFNSAPIMLTISSLENGEYLEANEQFLNTSEFSRDDIIGHTSVELGWVTKSDREKLLEMMLRDGKIHELDLTLRSKSGKAVLCKYWGEIITVAGQKRLLSIALDITEHRRVEQQFLQAQKMESIGRLAGGVAHDFNNMLGVIIGHAELALMHADQSNPLRKDLEQILDAANRSADITRQLLAFARQQTSIPKVQDLNESVFGMLKMLRRLIGEDVRLGWKPGYELWKVKIDPTQLDQILANLCVNARDAITGVGEIDIQTENTVIEETDRANHDDLLPGEYVLLSVSDNGSGMGKDIMEHIFEPFYTTKGIGRGTGLGLATVFGIVKQNNGHIKVYSEPGHGTVFRIYLPAEKSAADSTTKEKKPVIGGNETILIVEDELAILNLTTSMLSKLGYNVLSANSPEEAQRLAADNQGKIDLLVTDIIMPGMNGHHLWELLHLTDPNMKCLFMSGYTSDVMTERGKMDENVNFLQKPFSMQSLAEKIRDALHSGGR